MKVRKFFSVVLLILWVAVLTASAWAAYSSHQNDQDVNNFLAVYPFAKSTKLDDCSLCHKGGDITSGGKTSYYGSCDFCHQTYGLRDPHGDILLTLNSYGLAYNNTGKSQQALIDIGGLDSDGDGITNTAEIQALTFPGDPKDHPGLIPATAVVLNQERILKLSDYSEFLFFNASKSADWYARYRGVKIKDLLKYAGISRQATQITVFAPDGFSKTFPIDAPDPQSPSNIQYDVMGPYPYGYYYGGLDFVEYEYDPGYPHDNGYRIPDKLYMLLAYLRDGDPLTKGKLVPDPANPTRLVLEGEGPYRLIPPQKIAGSPDRPSANSDPTDPTWNYDSTKDHNAGSSVRSVTAIRVEPLPAGTTDFRWIEGGWNLVDRAKLVIYGAIDPRTYPVEGKVLDISGHPIADVKITFGLLSLGQVGEATSRRHSGKFHIDLPAGEYTVIPSKDGCTFTPGSLAISLSDPEYQSEQHRDPYEISLTGSCQ